MSRSTVVSYLANTHSVDDHTPLGSIIANYLIESKSPPSANVVGVSKDGSFFSFYSYDLALPLGSYEFDHITISKDRFINEEQKIYSLEKLSRYLSSVRSDYFEDNLLLEKVNRELKRSQKKIHLTTVPTVVEEPRRFTHAGIRHSVPYRAPVFNRPVAQPGPHIKTPITKRVSELPRAHAPQVIRRIQTEEEEIDYIRRTTPKPIRKMPKQRGHIEVATPVYEEKLVRPIRPEHEKEFHEHEEEYDDAYGNRFVERDIYDREESDLEGEFIEEEGYITELWD
jgi:hypothetical protein